MQHDSDSLVRLSPRRDGWTAARQTRFIEALAETGCITVAAREAGISVRSAYRLRAHPAGAAFAKAWDAALVIATGRLTTQAFERALLGQPTEVWRNGKLVGETCIPSERLMMFLLQRLAPLTLAPMSGAAAFQGKLDSARAALPTALGDLTDIDLPAADAPALLEENRLSPPRS